MRRFQHDTNKTKSEAITSSEPYRRRVLIVEGQYQENADVPDDLEKDS